MIAVCVCGFGVSLVGWDGVITREGLSSFDSICSQRNSVSLVFSFDDSNKAKASPGQRKRGQRNDVSVPTVSLCRDDQRKEALAKLCLPLYQSRSLPKKKKIPYIHLIRFSLSLAGIGS